jgi:hypothetical protein
MTRIAVLCLALLGAACATGGRSAAAQPDRFVLPDGTRMVCEMEMVTGTHLRERVCRRDEKQTVAEKEGQRQLLERRIPAVKAD